MIYLLVELDARIGSSYIMIDGSSYVVIRTLMRKALNLEDNLLQRSRFFVTSYTYG